MTAMSKKKHTKTQTLTQEHKTRLLYSVIKFIENNAFSKTLKRILSEAQIEGEEWKSVPLNLEDLYCNYLDTCNRDETTSNIIEKQDLHTEGTTKVDTDSHCVVSEEPSKKKKKMRSESEQGAVADESEAIQNKVSDSTKNSEPSEFAEANGKKKGKKGSDENKETQSLANAVSVGNGELSKEKKKKKSKSKNVDQEDIGTVRVEVEEQSEDLASAVSDVKKEKKSSKKRKRLVSDDNEIQSDDNETSEDCKRKKSKGSEKSEKNDKSKENEKEKCQVSNIDRTKTCTENPDEDKKADLTLANKAQFDNENGGDKSCGKKSAKKQKNGSAEPKSANAFQRVKIDEVEFADEKLQDNSYWAKSGAEIGYGAKAQEVLGQVRGRDFRHEKTKKKRGSYRGGLIDLQSHSVKFNYSDED